MLKGFNQNITKVLGRFIKLEYAEVNDIQKFLRIVKDDVVVTSPVFKEGFGWRNMPINHLGENSYNVEQRNTAQGNLYDVAINGTYPSVSAATLQEVERMPPPNFFVVKITKPNGQVLLMSDIENPLEFVSKISGGDIDNNLSRLLWQFKGTITFNICEII